MIEVADYDPAWPGRFSALRARYAAALAAAGVPVVAIEHVGSTAVPGLAAKPVIDCDIIVTADNVPAAAAVLVSLGLTPEGELGIPQRRAFREPAGCPRVNTYVIVDGCLALRNHLALREALRADEGLRAEYGAAKKRAGAVAAGIDEYLDLKGAVVQKVLAAAGLTEAERAEIAAANVPARAELPG